MSSLSPRQHRHAEALRRGISSVALGLFSTAIAFVAILPAAGESIKAIPEQSGEPFRVGLNYLAQPISNPAGGINNQFSWLNGLWLKLELGSGFLLTEERWRELDHWVLKFATASVRGNSAYYQQIGAAYPLQTMTSAGQWLSELTVKREPGTGSFGMKAGIFSLNPDFMESDIFKYYIHSALNDTFNNEVLAIPIAPLTSAGAQLNFRTSTQPMAQQWRIGAFAVVPTNTFGRSIQTGSQPLPLKGGIGLVQWQLGLGKPSGNSALPEPGVMVGGYWSETHASDRSDTSTNQLPKGLNRGIYGTTTFTLPPAVAGKLNTRAWAAGQYGFDWDNNPAPVFWAAGLLVQGLLPNRPLDVTGLAAASSGFSPSITPGSYQESVLEVNHQIQLSPALSIKPFAQLVLTPSGITSRPAILATGLQASIEF